MALSLIIPFPMHGIWTSACKSYERQVAKRPLLCNMATSAVLWSAGDIVAQRLQRQPIRASGLRKTALTGFFGGLFFGPAGED